MNRVPVFTDSEAVEAKAERILVEGRLWVKRRVGDDILAHVRNEHGVVYVCGWDLDLNNWVCSCRAGQLHHACCHLVALWMVTGVAEVAE